MTPPQCGVLISSVLACSLFESSGCSSLLVSVQRRPVCSGFPVLCGFVCGVGVPFTRRPFVSISSSIYGLFGLDFVCMFLLCPHASYLSPCSSLPVSFSAGEFSGDPFSDSGEDRLIGRAFLFLRPLLHGVDVARPLSIIDNEGVVVNVIRSDFGDFFFSCCQFTHLLCTLQKASCEGSSKSVYGESSHPGHASHPGHPAARPSLVRQERAVRRLRKWMRVKS